MITLFIKKITETLGKSREYKEFLAHLSKKEFSLTLDGPKGSFLAFFAAETIRLTGKQGLIVLPTEKEARELVKDLALTGVKHRFFPSWENLPYQDHPLQQNISGERAACISSILSGGSGLTVVSLRSFLTPIGNPELLKKYNKTLVKGESIDTTALDKFLAETGYLKVPTASVPGEFALRGEVLDIFLAGDEYPVRIVFDFDRIEEIRLYDPENQRSLTVLSSITLYPAREIIWTEKGIEKLLENLKKMNCPDSSFLENEIKEFKTIIGEEMLFPLSNDKIFTLGDLFKKDAMLFAVGTERLLNGSENLKKEIIELYSQARRKGKWYPPPALILNEYSDSLERFPRVINLPMFTQDKKAGPVLSFPCNGPRSYFGNITYFKEELSNLLTAGYSITLFAESNSQALKLENLLKGFDLDIVPASLSSGFTLPQYKIIALDENEIFGRKKRLPASIKKVKTASIETFVELNPGDYVVHISYGIGLFKGIDRIKAAGMERDYIKLEYADSETIFIPLEQVNLVQRYIGSESSSPRLDKIGGASWERRKERVKKAVEDLADMLIKLYSRRKQISGYAFPKDTDWQVEFEATFPYEETEDQLRCIEEVKKDMENSKPMDRLVCGDVGYGKTEIAMRAAFKAVMGGKQVAFLAPTTILTEQHYNNFTDRFEKFPVKIAMISRFVAKGEQKKVLKALEEGEIDIIIGTHRLLQKDVRFKNLGLMIIDEEQRFGVKDKEMLKKMKTSLDCLALSATPIPRTLHMSLLKIRDMSLLNTAPYNRHPIETHIEEFNDGIIINSIRKEVERGGQVFYLHNRIETLKDIKIFLNRILPEIMVEMAHGKMNSSELEEIMHRFVHGGFQVLLATTIIENGIDIPNVNTIIIDRADMYGISQLYQLKGRVGRSDRKAYAFLLYPERRSISELAMKRLSIISDFTELGSGFKIALKDMEVRGAGNLLGREQHGEIASVGFDMYLRLLDEAIAEASGDKEVEGEEIYMELEYTGFIPDSYITSSLEKMEIYKKIASIQKEEELDRISEELIDRFGPLPEEVHSLLSLAEIRILCRKLHIANLKEKKGIVAVQFARVAHLSVEKVMQLIREGGGNVRLDPHRPEVLLLKTQGIKLEEKSEFMREKLSLLV